MTHQENQHQKPSLSLEKIQNLGEESLEAVTGRGGNDGGSKLRKSKSESQLRTSTPGSDVLVRTTSGNVMPYQDFQDKHGNLLHNEEFMKGLKVMRLK
jgi:hypothetical protein